MKKKIFIIILCFVVLFTTISCKKKSEENIVNSNLSKTFEDKEINSSQPVTTEKEQNIVNPNLLKSFEDKEIIPSQPVTIEKEENIEIEKNVNIYQNGVTEEFTQDFEFYLEDFHITGRAQGFKIQINYDKELENFFKSFLTTLNLGFDKANEEEKESIIINLPSDSDVENLLYEIIGKIFSFNYVEELEAEVISEDQNQSFSYNFLGFPLELVQGKNNVVIEYPKEFTEKDVFILEKVTQKILSYDFKNLSCKVENNQIILDIDREFESKDFSSIQNSLEAFSLYEFKTIFYSGEEIYLAVNAGKAYLFNPFSKEETQNFLNDNIGFLNDWKFITDEIVEVVYSSEYSNNEFIFQLEKELNRPIEKTITESPLEFELYVENINLHFSLFNNDLTVVFSEKMNENLLKEKVEELSIKLGVEVGEIFYDSAKNVLILPILSSDYPENLFDNLITSLYQY
ncbi:MAG: hypothetical protein PHD05_04215 [Sphaerochaetaceae bacterium]|nr:hypothetical protein [Sphaerochaetaceae bacterium]